ncbi:hypothetical protein [Bifidobacterium pseudolongum]|uniref:Uncharacterized protein n=1 Tax=Bifidobacterium pseudolongum subsp. globosum TaxID=1690 RepID=A0AB37X2V1_9BIFI|nr:hypothetical protein [Bifidobacterium pseudolongum]RYQ39783.1 hypothetical protein PG2002B_0102 [Bifidobacterium pseudolongum subsp. globosum]
MSNDTTTDDTTQETPAMQPDTTAENDLQAAKLKKANEEAKAYRLKLRDAEQTLERTVAEKDAALADARAQVDCLAQQLDVADRTIMRKALAEERTYTSSFGAPPAAGTRINRLRPEFIDDVMDNIEYWQRKVYGDVEPLSRFTRENGSLRRLGDFMRRLAKIAPHMFAPINAAATDASQVVAGMGGQRYTR